MGRTRETLGMQRLKPHGIRIGQSGNRETPGKPRDEGHQLNLGPLGRL